jgi:hypothetical protein
MMMTTTDENDKNKNDDNDCHLQIEGLIALNPPFLQEILSSNELKRKISFDDQNQKQDDTTNQQQINVVVNKRNTKRCGW